MILYAVHIMAVVLDFVFKIIKAVFIVCQTILPASTVVMNDSYTALAAIAVIVKIFLIKIGVIVCNAVLHADCFFTQ